MLNISSWKKDYDSIMMLRLKPLPKTTKVIELCKSESKYLFQERGRIITFFLWSIISKFIILMSFKVMSAAPLCLTSFMEV